MWEDKTDYFTEKERHYKDTYLEISEVLDNTIEASLFSSEVGDYEIYVCYGKMVGIVYANADEAESLRQQMKKDLAVQEAVTLLADAAKVTEVVENKEA